MRDVILFIVHSDRRVDGNRIFFPYDIAGRNKSMDSLQQQPFVIVDLFPRNFLADFFDSKLESSGSNEHDRMARNTPFNIKQRHTVIAPF